MQKNRVRIENWSVVSSVVFDAYRDLVPGERLTGNVLGHANLRNGLIYTSPILNVDRANGLVETHNTLYELGEADPDYKQWVQAQERVRAA